MARPWFRFYRSVLHSAKLQRLKPELFKAWANMLCASDDEGCLPPVDDLAFALRVGPEKIAEWLAVLTKAGLFEALPDGNFVAHDWSEHQRDSDVSNARVQRFRDRKRNVTGNECNGDGNVTGNASVSVQIREDTDKSRGEGESASAPPSKPKPECFTGEAPTKTPRATRWPPDAVVPDDWLELGRRRREQNGLPEIDLRLQATLFANYWAAKAGGSAAKNDWQKTWVNWCLKAHENGNNSRQSWGNNHPFGPFGALLEREIDQAGHPEGADAVDGDLRPASR